MPGWPRLFVSTAITGDIAHMLGAPHYSYHFAASRFTTMLARAGHAPHHLTMPEYYASASAMPGGMRDTDMHIIFRSTEQIRLLKPARANICCFAWEFPVLKTSTLPGEHPFANQRSMLQLCDEIWVPSTFAQQVLLQHGLPRSFCVPAPIPLPDGRAPSRARAIEMLGHVDAATLDVNFAWPDAYQTERSAATIAPLSRFLATHARPRQRPTIFLSILNPEDFRKNLDSLLRGFHLLRQRHPGAILIVKALTSPARFDLGQVAGGVIRNKLSGGTVLHDAGIAIINAFLSDKEMSALYGLADFYLCTSIAEGQNLPLLEAMAHGTIAVTSRNTAMLDYITHENAHVIAHDAMANHNIHLAGCIAQQPFDVAHCTAQQVATALQQALASSSAARAAMRRAALDTVMRQFSEQAILTRVHERLRCLASA